MTVIVVIILLGLGLIFGSFVNALVWRLHEQANLKSKKATTKAQKADREKLSIVHGRSMCPHCRHELAAKDLVPLFSWLWLRGKCRYCRHKIDDNPFVELTLPFLFVFSYAFWPLSLRGVGLVTFCFWLAFLVGFAALTVYDLKWYILPDKVVWPLVVLALVQLLVRVFCFGVGWHALFVAGLGVLVASGLFWLLFLVSQGTWIGGGDVKLGIVIGLLLGGFEPSFLMLFLASAIGTLVSLPLLLSGRLKRSSALPFGPFLLVATVIVTLFGASLIGWFHRLFLA